MLTIKNVARQAEFWGVCIGVMIALSADAVEIQEAPKDIITVRPTKKAPVIDGKLDDAAWKKALKISDFIDFRTFRKKGLKEPVKVQTTAFLTFDKDNLYVAFDCPFPEGEDPKRYYYQRDDMLFDDDECVEFWVDPTGSAQTKYHFGANANGTLVDGFEYLGGDFDVSWNAANAQCAAQVGKTRWTVELAIPFKDLADAPDARSLWRMNFGRERRPGREHTELSSTTGQFCEGSKFHYVRFDLPGKHKAIEVASLGGLCKSRYVIIQPNSFDVIVRAGHKPVTASVSRIDRGKKTLLASRKSRTTNEDVLLRVPYEGVDMQGVRFTFEVKDAAGKVIFQKTALAKPRPKLYQPHPNPLYEELLTDNDPGIGAEGMPFSPVAFFDCAVKHHAKRYAIVTDAELIAREYAEHRVIPLNSMVFLGDTYRVPEFARRFGLRVAVWPATVYQANEAHLFYEPYSTIFKKSVWRIADSGKNIWAIFWSGEFSERLIRRMLRYYDGDGKRKYQKYIRTELSEKVKKETGYGKFGIPQGSRDENPFRCIAWMRYVNKELRKILGELRKDIRKKHPYLRFMNENISGTVKPLEHSAAADADICDFFSPEVMPSTAGHIVKAMADLTGKEVIPHIHSDHYDAWMSWDPEQVREIMSIVFRSGATGFLAYDTDCSDPQHNMVSTQLSAPERWQAYLALTDRIQKQAKVKYPEPDLGVFYCNTSFQAFNPYVLNFWDAPVIYAYDVFGPQVMRSWFRFVDENIIFNHKGALDGFKAIMLNFGKYQLPGILEKLEEYAANGGTVLCFDPEAFTWAADGTSLIDARKRAFGVETGPLLIRNGETVTFRDASLGIAKGKTLPVLARVCAVKALPGTRVLAAFSNGDPAIVEKKTGKGRMIFFAFNPVNSLASKNIEWYTAFRNMGKGLGVKLDRDIWRFTFPPFERDLYPKDPDGICLTDNYQRFQNDVPIPLNNLDVKGTYRLSPSADKVLDQGGTGEVFFNKGDLTDRRFAYAQNAKPGPSDNYLVSWKENVPVEVVFDFKQAYPVNRVRLFYAERLPRFTVHLSTDGKSWNEAAHRDTEQQTDGVRMVQRRFAPQTAQYVKISFAKRDKDWKYDKRLYSGRETPPRTKVPEHFLFVEAEVWAAGETKK